MKDLLQGKPLRHPLHPALVHLPIGLFALSFLLDIASLITAADHGFVRASFYSMGLGVVTGILAAIVGFVDYVDIRNDHPAKKLGTAHMLLNLAVIGLYAVNLGIRYSALGEVKVGMVPFSISVLAVGLLSFSGYLGGSMVYDNGIGVGRHRRKTDLPEATILLTSAAAKGDAFIPVTEAGAVKEGETLRVQVKDTVFVLTRWNGQFFAFQEFCPHRFGPLSEGALCDGEVECPWRRSRFDIRTGKVTRGPAKVELKTFPVQTRDGKIYVAIPG